MSFINSIKLNEPLNLSGSQFPSAIIHLHNFLFSPLCTLPEMARDIVVDEMLLETIESYSEKKQTHRYRERTSGYQWGEGSRGAGRDAAK